MMREKEIIAQFEQGIDRLNEYFKKTLSTDILEKLHLDAKILNV